MTQNEIIEMAKENGIAAFNGVHIVFELSQLETFAKLVASEAIAKKHEELYRLAEDAPVRGDARETRQNILHAIRIKGEA